MLPYITLMLRRKSRAIRLRLKLKLGAVAHSVLNSE